MCCQRGAHVYGIQLPDWRLQGVLGSVHLGEVSILEKCPSWRSVHLGEVSTLEKCPSWRSVHLREVSTLEKFPF